MKRIAILFFACFGLITGLFSQVSAKFSTADKVTGCPPLFVHFVNESSGSGALSYKWDFGNGATSTQKDPSNTFTVSGKYTIKLFVSNGTDTASMVKTTFIDVFYPPIIGYFPNDTITSCAPSEIQFLNNSSAGSSAIVELKWDFGDGYINQQTNPKHTYTVPGIYTPSLSAKDANGCLASASISNQIKVYKPMALFASSESETCEGALTIQFSNLSNGSGKLSYLWNYGDGTYAAVKDSSHYFEKVGKYDVSLKVIDGQGCSDTIVKPSYVKITAISASFELPSDTVCPNTLVQFLNTTLAATSFNWDFGDGVKSTLQNPKHTYTKSGVYQVTLAANNGLCGGISKMSIVVEELKADFVPQMRYGCQLPMNVKYINKSTNAVSYNWRFGNKTTSTLKEPVVVFQRDSVLDKFKQRSYTDTLIITSARGCKNRFFLDSSMVVVLPQPNFSPNPTDPVGSMSGCAPLTVNFKDKSIYNSKDDGISSYKWEFNGDNKPTRNVKEFTEVFTKDMVTEVVLTITTQLGCTASLAYNFSAGYKQTPDFDITNTSHTLCASETVTFLNKSVDNNKIQAFKWSWGDGRSSTMEDSHDYTKIGPMTVTLQVNSFGCSASITKADFITIKGPISNYKDSSNCSNPFVKNFISDVLDATSYNWDLGDGTTIANQSKVSHTYLKKGDYTVVLNSVNGGCAYSLPKIIKVRDLVLNSTVLAPVPCENSTLVFNSTNSEDTYEWRNGGVLKTFLWNFGDGTKPIFTSEKTVGHTFKKRGNYRVVLVSKDENLCADSIVTYQRVYRPSSDFTSEYLHGCMPVDFKFTNKSIADTLSSLLSYKWIFGDGNTSSDINPSHQYFKWGNYNVSLVVNDNQGCSDTIVKPGAVSALYPNPKFIANKTTLCVGDEASFASVVPATIASYLWTFPDGSTSTSATPTHKFPADGSFDVKLHVVDKHGCDSLGVQSGFVKVQKYPIVNFTADPLESNCYPTEVTFNDLSISDYLGSWRWDFGDSKGMAYRQNPQHVYIRPGKFDIKLVASTTYGCSDSLIKSSYVNPKGPYAEIVAKDTICRDAALTLEMVNPLNVYSFKWDLGDGIVLLNPSITHTYRSVGYFNPGLFLVSDSLHSCDKFIRDTVYVPETLAKYKLNNASPNGCVPYAISYTNLSTQYKHWLWNFGNGQTSNDLSPQYTYSSDGIFLGMLSVKSELGCTDSVSLNPITVFPLPTVTVSNDQFICLNSSTLLEATGGVEYEWSPSIGLNDAKSSTPTASPNFTTRYSVLVTDIHSCQRKDSLQVTVQQFPVAQAPDSIIIVGESVQINVEANDIKSYSWAPNYNISCTDCPNPIVSPLRDTIYTVTVKDTANCFTKEYSSKYTIQFKYSVDMPSAFTPNGDGINDAVFVKGWGIKELITFRVFNRFGQMIFETNDINKGWDGDGHGSSQTGDSFQFIVKIRTFGDAVITKSGTIKIIK